MAYTKTNWVNDTSPAINATNLNNIENGISANDTAIGDISTLDTTATNLVDAVNEVKGDIPVVSDTYSTSTTGAYSSNYINGEVLYESTAGTTGTVTLSNSAANYRYMEIYGKTTDVSTSIKLDNPNGKSFSVNTRYAVGTLFVMPLSFHTINGTSITPDLTKCGYANITNTGAANFNFDNTNYFLITKVIGYR